MKKVLRSTLMAVELDRGEPLELQLADGSVRRIQVERTDARVYSSDLPDLREGREGARTVVRMHCWLRIDGHGVELVRWVGNQQSFYEPWQLFGLQIWFDACVELFDLLKETHGQCKPRKHVRLAFQAAGRPICPELLHPWCPLPPGTLRIEDCYQGADCWLGPYFGTDAHAGLDINHPAGTPIWTPLAFDEHELFASIDRGDNNNRWRALRRWEDGSCWTLQVHHIIRLLVPEHQSISAGVHLADGAGVLCGSHPHSHFEFKVREPGTEEDIPLDPWILFWKMYQDRAATERKGII